MRLNVVALVAALGLVGACAAESGGSVAGPELVAERSAATVIASTEAPATTTSAPTTTPTRVTVGSTTTTSTSTTSTSTSTSTTTTTTLAPLPMTSCESVAHISDSTGVFLWDVEYVESAANTMEARYRSVGVQSIVHDDSGGRSVIERSADWQTTALEVADSIRSGGFDGCWVVMIGTNDAANITAGASISAEDRINRMLWVFGDDPVLWVDAATALGDGAYSNTSMRGWNEVLYRIADERPNVSVLRWSDRVLGDWFVADGVHYRTEGRIWRAAITASALAAAFPAG